MIKNNTIITQLEKKYQLKIKPFINDQYWFNQVCYETNGKGEIEYLSLPDCNIDSLEIISELSGLRFLYLKGNHLKKIEGFDKFPKLEVLSLWSSKNINKIEGLEKLSSLKELYIGNNNIAKIEGLQRLIHLEKLHIRGLRISKIEGLENLTQLEELSIISDKLTKLEGVSSLKELHTLEIDARIEKIENLDKLTKLRKLSLKNGIRKIENLNTLINLEWLSLSSNKIEKIENLEYLIHLRYLNLLGNNLTTLEGLDEQRNLEELVLYSTGISEIGNINGLIQLRKLNLRLNKLRSVPDFSALINLKKLDLSQNQLTQKPDFSYLPKLKDIDLTYNPIRTKSIVISTKQALTPEFIISNLFNTGGYDEEKEADICEILDEIGYQYTIEDNSVYKGKINNKLKFKISYQPEETIFSLNGFEIAVQSGHCELGFFTWKELKAISSCGKKYSDLWFFIFLTATVVEKNEINELREEINKHLMNVGFNKKYIGQIIGCLECVVSSDNMAKSGNESFTINSQFNVLESNINHSTRIINKWKDKDGFVNIIKELEALTASI